MGESDARTTLGGVDTDQTRVITWLSSPAAYDTWSRAADASGASGPPGTNTSPRTVERLETHGALVFLCGNEAIKIKRAVRFSYMDFSTLAMRQQACARELELNRPHAPAIYLGVLAITDEGGGRLAFNGSGPVVEWAVHMRRFAQADILSARAARTPLPVELCRDLADAVAAFHAAAPRSQDHDTVAQLRAVSASIAEGLDSVADFAFGDRPQQLHARASAAISQVASVLAQRAGSGFVRRCHGDLHLNNIVLLNGRPVLFDALEFDEALATVDTLYDLAFLLMDLGRNQQRPAANMVLNRYLWRTNAMDDITGLAALPLFMALRAGVRAMVTAQRAAQEQGAARQTDLASARNYLTRALAHLDPHTPALVVIGGLSGSGKSTLAAELAPWLAPLPGALHLRSDLERKALFGVEPTERLPPEAYTPATSQRVYDILLVKTEAALRAGTSVISDAVYATPQERADIERVAQRTGSTFAALWLDAPPEVLKSRVAQRHGDASDATVETVSQQVGYDLGALAWTRIDASGPATDTRAHALKHLQQIIGTP